MDKRVKKIIACSASFIIIAGAIIISDIFLKYRSSNGVQQSIGIYNQPRETIDVLMLGSSHMYYGINTAKLWEDYGIAGYDFGSSEQSLWVSYHYMVEACKTQKPKVVVLDFFTPAAFQDDHKYKYTFLADSLYGLKFSFNKLMLMHACFDNDLALWNKYFPSFMGYHDRYGELGRSDLEKIFTDYAAFKGYVPYFEKSPTSGFELDTESVLPPSEKSVKYLKKIVEYTKKHNIRLYITVVPYKINDEQVTGVVQEEDKRYNWLEQYVEELRSNGDDHVYFDYTAKHMESFDLEMESGEDMYDSTHLNYYGSCKFTDYLAEDLRRMYGYELIPDHRGDPDYCTWDENVEMIREDVLSYGFEWR